MMKHFFPALFLVLLAASPGWAKPRVSQPNPTNSSALITTVTFIAGDTTESDPIGINGTCSVRYSQVSGDDASLYAVPTTTTAATSGTLIGAFTASTTTPTVWQAGTLYVKAIATDATAGGSTMVIHCSPSQVAEGGGGVLGYGDVADMEAYAGTKETGDLFWVEDDADGNCSGSDGAGTTLCAWNGASWEPAGAAGAGLANVVDDETPQLGGDLDPNGKAIGTRNFYASTQAEIEAALAVINDADANGIGANELTGGTILLEGGEIAISSTLDVCGDGTGALGCNGLRMIGVGGGPENNTNFYSNQGTVLRWTGAAGGTVMTIGACESCEFAYFSINSDNNVTPGDDADHGVELLPATSAATKVDFHHVGIMGSDSYAIMFPTSGQVDESTFHDMVVSYNDACVQVNDSQSIGLVFGPNFVCTQSTGTGPLIDIQEGSIIYKDSYLGIGVDSSVGISQSNLAGNMQITGSQFEFNGRTGVTVIDADTVTNGQSGKVVIDDNQFVYDTDGNTAISIEKRGSVQITNNRQVNQGATDNAFDLDIVVNRDDGATANRLKLSYWNNTVQRPRTSFVGYATPELWVPTIGAGVLTDPGTIASATLPSTSSSDCIDGTIGVDIDDGSLKVCESDAWIDPPNLAGGGGDPVLVNTTPITASGGIDLVDGEGLVLGTPTGDPSVVDFSIDFGYDYGYGGAAEKCFFTTTGTGSGGFLCEGQTANAIEYRYTFPTRTEATADAEWFIPLSSASTQTTPGTSACARWDSSGNLVAASGDCASGDTGGGGTANILDLGDDGGNDSTDLVEIATTGDTNSIFTEPTANKLLIAVGNDWPKSDVADAVTIADNESTNETNAVLFTPGGDLDGGNLTPESDGDFTYNPSTGTVGASVFDATGGSDGVWGFDLKKNTSAIGEGSTGRCKLGFVGETLNKHCVGGALTSLEGGSSAFSAITGSTNTTADMVVGAGATLRPSSTGVIEATEVDVAAGAAPTANGAVAFDSTANDLEYGDNGTNRKVVNTDEAQTLSSKTLASPVISGTASGNATIPTAMLVQSAVLRTRVCSIPIVADGSGDLTHVDQIARCKVPDAATLQKVSCSSSANSFGIEVFERANTAPNTGTTGILGGALTCNSDGTPDEDTAFSDAAIAADAYLVLDITTESLAAGEHGFIAIEYTVD